MIKLLKIKRIISFSMINYKKIYGMLRFVKLKRLVNAALLVSWFRSVPGNDKE